MKVQHFVLAPDQHEPALSVLGTQVTVLASNAATQSYGITFKAEPTLILPGIPPEYFQAIRFHGPLPIRYGFLP